MMRKILIGIFLLAFVCNIYGQEYLNIITLKEMRDTEAVFTSVGKANSKKEVEANAAKSLFNTLLFKGFEGINEGKPFVCKPNKPYTNSFFNSSSLYVHYVSNVETAVKPRSIGGTYQGIYTFTVRLRALLRDVQNNTHGVDNSSGIKHVNFRQTPKPTIIVVPYKKEGESYKSILENDFDRRVAVAEVQKGFENLHIKTIDLQAKLEAVSRRAQYEENAGVADSNDKQLLVSSGADVYVVVDVKKDVNNGFSRVSLTMKAYETSTGVVWGSQSGWTGRYKTNATDLLCAYAAQESLPPFLAEIERNYLSPTRVVLQFSLGGSSIASLQDLETNEGDVLIDMLFDWLDDNAYNGDYHLQGEVPESIIFDYVMIPNTDEKGRKMGASKFCRLLQRALRKAGIVVNYVIEGNNIVMTLSDM